MVYSLDRLVFFGFFDQKYIGLDIEVYFSKVYSRLASYNIHLDPDRYVSGLSAIYISNGWVPKIISGPYALARPTAYLLVLNSRVGVDWVAVILPRD